MKIQYSPKALKLIQDHACQITISLQSEECYACCGQRTTNYPSVRLGKPENSQMDEYELLLSEGINVYVEKKLYHFDTSVTFGIDVSNTPNETFNIYGIPSK